MQTRAELVRAASTEEEAEILAAYAEHSGQDREDLSGQRIYIACGYITACPGYAGPVALIHWDGSPEFVSVLTFERAGAGYAWRVLADHGGGVERARAPVYVVPRESADGPELDIFAEHALAVEWAECIGSTVIEEQPIGRAILDAMKEARTA